MTVEVVVRGRHMDVPEQFREVAVEKLQRLQRFGIDINRIDVEVSRERNPRQSDRAIEVEITCRGKGRTPMRAEAHAEDKFAALEVASDTLSERLRRMADKRRSQRRRHARVIAADVSEVQALAGVEDEEPVSGGAAEVMPEPGVVLAEGPVIVREKRHETSPMTVVDALDALEAVGHDFYFFHDSEADRPSVIYRRRGYDYGLIRLDMTAGR